MPATTMPGSQELSQITRVQFGGDRQWGRKVPWQNGKHWSQWGHLSSHIVVSSRYVTVSNLSVLKAELKPTGKHPNVCKIKYIPEIKVTRQVHILKNSNISKQGNKSWQFLIQNLFSLSPPLKHSYKQKMLKFLVSYDFTLNFF